MLQAFLSMFDNSSGVLINQITDPFLFRIYPELSGLALSRIKCGSARSISFHHVDCDCRTEQFSWESCMYLLD